MKFTNYERTLDYKPINGDIVNQLWRQYNSHQVLYNGEHILFNEYAKTVDLFMSEINKLNHNIEVLKSNRVTVERMESAIAQFEYLNEKFMQVETGNLTYELWLLCRDMLKTMMENSGYYKLEIFSDNDDLVECDNGGN